MPPRTDFTFIPVFSFEVVLYFQAEEVFSLALETDDEMFHVALYEWLIAKKLSDKLLEVRDSF